jgi:uncharacterized membrane protein YeaQ/YmgE (transglycosylase-associated protein family)
MGMLPFICYLIVAAVCAVVAERFVPSGIRGGWIASGVVGVVGGWFGGSLIGHFGPELTGVALIPCILGSAVLVFAFSIYSGGFKRKLA